MSTTDQHAPSTDSPQVDVPRTDPNPRRPFRVLLVDDDPVLLGLMSREFRRWCIDPVLSASVDDACLQLRPYLNATGGLDAVVCDGLEGGWEDVHALAQAARIPFVLISGSRSHVAWALICRVPAYLRGGDDFLPRLRRALSDLPGTWPPADLAERLPAPRAL